MTPEQDYQKIKRPNFAKKFKKKKKKKRKKKKKKKKKKKEKVKCLLSHYELIHVKLLLFQEYKNKLEYLIPDMKYLYNIT